MRTSVSKQSNTIREWFRMLRRFHADICLWRCQTFWFSSWTVHYFHFVPRLAGAFPEHTWEIWQKIRLSFACTVCARHYSPALCPVVVSVWSAGSWKPPLPRGKGSATCSSVRTDTCWTDRWGRTPGRTYCSSRRSSMQTGSTERRTAEKNPNAVWMTLTRGMLSSLLFFIRQQLCSSKLAILSDDSFPRHFTSFVCAQCNIRGCTTCLKECSALSFW